MSTTPLLGLDQSPGRIALVTGASRGVGEATARLLAGQGYSVVVNYAADQRRADQVVESILATRGAALAIRADVTDEVDVERLFSETVEWCGGVDAVVHAVIGEVPAGPLAETTVEQFDALTRLHARSTFLVNREGAKHLQPGGAIVNFSSSLTHHSGQQYPAHAATEAATDMLTRAFAAELVDRGIRVNAIALDFTGPCVPERVAGSVAVLLSAEGGTVTGQIIGVNDLSTTSQPREKERDDE
jgi:3-oxoacyl-[acyl-carrier protein] reductase